MAVIGTIADDATLAAFDALWSEQVRQPRGIKTQYRYTFDLGTVRGTKTASTRWVYNVDGFAKVMVLPNIGAEIPVYRIPAAAELNRLVGITEAETSA